MLKAIPMVKAYIIAPRNLEDRVLEEIGKLGLMQLESGLPIKELERAKTAEICDRYMKLLDRIEKILEILPKEEVKKPFFEKLREAFIPPPRPKVKPIEQTDLFVVEKRINEISERIDKLLAERESISSEIESLNSLRRRIMFVKQMGLSLDQIGTFTHIFVKIGLIHTKLLPNLRKYVVGTKITYTHKPVEKMQELLLVVGPREEREYIEEALTLLNFEEFTFPEDLPSNPDEALSVIDSKISEKQDQLNKIDSQLKELCLSVRNEAPRVLPTVSRILTLERARSNVNRTRTASVIFGWIPKDKFNLLKERLSQISSSIYVTMEEPSKEERAPYYVKHKGILKQFEVFTRMLGAPHYREINPTPFFTILFPIMFGMMFGDIGGGLFFIILGIIFSKLQKGFMGLSVGAIKRLGKIYLLCGILAVIFGILYGECFLKEVFEPILLSPRHDLGKIMEIAIIFGIIQIILGLVLNIINEFRIGEKIKALLSWKGLAGLIYYICGIFLALSFMNGGWKLEVFLRADVLPFTIVALSCLIVSFLSPTLEGIIGEGHVRLSESLIMGVAELLEMVISFIANSISYVRLAAFAIAHGAFGMLAEILSESIGELPSFVAINAAVIVLEGIFAATIQSLRLMYYEFSTKFYKGGGIPYKPFRLPSIV